MLDHDFLLVLLRCLTTIVADGNPSRQTFTETVFYKFYSRYVPSCQLSSSLFYSLLEVIATGEQMKHIVTLNVSESKLFHCMFAL